MNPIEVDREISRIEAQRTDLLNPFFKESRFKTFLDANTFSKNHAIITSINRTASRDIAELRKKANQ